MPSSIAEADLDVQVTSVAVTDDVLTIELEDGRTISLPIQWYPRLHHGTPEERAKYEIGPLGVHWPDLDEDLSTRGLILGHRSGESPESLKFWLDSRRQGKKVSLQDFMRNRRKVAAKKATRKRR